MDEAAYKRLVEQERSARQQAENVAEEKNRELADRNRELKALNGELEEANQQLQQKAKQLEEANRYKNEFLANVSHELRTPLNSVLVLAKTLATNQNKNLTSDQIESANVILASGNDLLQLINEILDLSRIQAGRLSIVEDAVILQDLSRYLLKMFKPLAAQKQIEFIISQDVKLPPAIVTDSQRLQQIIKNLLANAIKFTEKGQVCLKLEVADKDWLRISVEDSGIGIPQDKQQVIFEAFTQADGSTTRHYGGTGLGLTISNKLAKLLGGRLEVRSEPGKGSCFSLLLPIKTTQIKTTQINSDHAHSGEDAEAVSLPVIISEKLKDKQVLLVEDDLRAGFALSKYLQQLGVKVSIADNGRFGLRKLLEEDSEFDLAILDILMPVMDGYDVLEGLENAPETRQLPIIVTSAKAYPKDRKKALDSGASEFLAKPVDLEELVSMMEKLLV